MRMELDGQDQGHLSFHWPAGPKPSTIIPMNPMRLACSLSISFGPGIEPRRRESHLLLLFQNVAVFPLLLYVADGLKCALNTLVSD